MTCDSYGAAEELESRGEYWLAMRMRQRLGLRRCECGCWGHGAASYRRTIAVSIEAPVPIPDWLVERVLGSITLG